MPDSQPHFGHTRHGLPVHLRAADHLPALTRADRFNKRLALRVTGGVGTMWCAYIFAGISLSSLPSTLALHSVNADVQWVAQTFLQLVLLSVIITGQNIQTAAGDVRAAKQFEDTELVVDRLDEHTAGGIRSVLDAVGKVSDDVAGLAEAVRAGRKDGVT